VPRCREEAFSLFLLFATCHVVQTCVDSGGALAENNDQILDAVYGREAPQHKRPNERKEIRIRAVIKDMIQKIRARLATIFY